MRRGLGAVRMGALAACAVGAATLALAPLALAQPPGDAGRGLQWLQRRADTACVMCHQIPGLPVGGAIGPSLEGVARLGASALRERIADARRFNPDTVMPPYRRTDGLQHVAAAYRGQPLLTEQQLDDIVAYLLQAGAARPSTP